MHSLDFTVNRFFMKLFQTSNMEIVKYCQSLFGCELPSVLLAKRYDKFICQTLVKFYYAALLPRRGPHIASHSVCLSVRLSVCPSVPLSLPSVTSFRQPLAPRVYFSARTEGRISYGHLGRTNSCFI